MLGMATTPRVGMAMITGDEIPTPVADHRIHRIGEKLLSQILGKNYTGIMIENNDTYRRGINDASQHRVRC